MFFGVSIFLLLGLLKFSESNNELTCACIWAGLRFVLGLLAMESLLPNTLWSLASFAVAYGYFYFLRREESMTIKWFFVVIIGGGTLLYL